MNFGDFHSNSKKICVVMHLLVVIRRKHTGLYTVNVPTHNELKTNLPDRLLP